MMKFTILVIASVLAPGFHAALVQTRPAAIPEIRPSPVEPELRPQIPGNTPELRPLPQPDNVPELRPLPQPESPEKPLVPELVTVNPCHACFEYMTALIDQLATIPQVPEAEDDGMIVRPLPIPLPEDLRPLPVPEGPEVEIIPIPVPVLPEVEVRPLPIPVAPEVEINPIPLPVGPQIRPALY